MKLSLVNYLLFQLGWVACAISAASLEPQWGLLVAGGIVGWHLVVSHRRIPEVKLLLTCAAVGAVFDSLLLATGWVSYPSGQWIPGLAPVWIIAMWLLFATTLNLSMSWLKGRPWAAALMGFIGGPLSYLAGARLDAIQLLNTPMAMIALAGAWAAIMPVICNLAQRWNGFGKPPVPGYVKSDWRDMEASGNAL